MQPKFICDENLPNYLVRNLKESGYDVVEIEGGINDEKIAERAKEEQRAIITFDSDFSNILIYPPEKFFGILRIRVSPPLKKVITGSLNSVLEKFDTKEKLKGKLVIIEPNSFRVWDKNMDPFDE